MGDWFVLIDELPWVSELCCYFVFCVVVVCDFWLVLCLEFGDWVFYWLVGHVSLF